MEKTIDDKVDKSKEAHSEDKLIKQSMKYVDKDNFKFNLNSLNLWIIGTGALAGLAIGEIYHHNYAAAAVAATGTVVAGIMSHFSYKDVMRDYDEKRIL